MSLISDLRLLIGDVRERLRDLPSDYFQTICTSPPYYGLRAYKTLGQVWGGALNCEHDWQHRRYYTEKSAGASSRDSFHEAGKSNAQRLKDARWREDDTCALCGAWRGELGAESTVQQYVANLVEVCREVRRVLRTDGLFFLNLGDSYCSRGGRTKQGASSQRGGRSDVAAANAVKGIRPNDRLKNKDLLLVPARVAIALVDDGWWLRNSIIWHKPSCKPESVTDRFTMDYEHVLMLARSSRYFFDADAVRELHKTSAKDQARQHNTRGKQAYAAASAGGFRGNAQQDAYAGLGFGAGGRNRRSVWSINPKPYKGAHFACFPEALVEIPLRAATSEGGACSKCGTPCVRVAIKGEPDRNWQAACGGDSEGRYDGQATKDYAAAGAENASAVKARILEGMRPKLTLGFRFNCKCWGEVRSDFPRTRSDRKRRSQDVQGTWRQRVARHLKVSPVTTRPCRVLDPFGGSGTTAAVAHKLELDCTLIDLQADYAALAVERVAKAGGVLKVIGLELPEIRELLAAAAVHPTLPREVEWELEEQIDEGSGWAEDQVFEGFAWANRGE